MRIIFDLGANKGQNLDYFLANSDLVVAVEPNPDLCKVIHSRFSSEISDGRLFLENICLVDRNLSGSFVNFYINKKSHVNSSLNIPLNPEKSEKISVIGMTASDLIKKYLKKEDVLYYVKIDLEGYDSIVLHDILSNHIYPEFISAEFQGIEVFAELIHCGKYNAFKTGDEIKTNITHNYDQNDFNSDTQSSGRFGNDLPGDWLDVDGFFYYLALTGKKGIDIHASLSHLPNTLISNKYLFKNIRNLLIILKIEFTKYVLKVLKMNLKRIKTNFRKLFKI